MQQKTNARHLMNGHLRCYYYAYNGDKCLKNRNELSVLYVHVCS